MKTKKNTSQKLTYIVTAKKIRIFFCYFYYMVLEQIKYCLSNVCNNLNKRQYEKH